MDTGSTWGLITHISDPRTIGFGRGHVLAALGVFACLALGGCLGSDSDGDEGSSNVGEVIVDESVSLDADGEEIVEVVRGYAAAIADEDYGTACERYLRGGGVKLPQDECARLLARGGSRLLGGSGTVTITGIEVFSATPKQERARIDLATGGFASALRTDGRWYLIPTT